MTATNARTVARAFVVVWCPLTEAREIPCEAYLCDDNGRALHGEHENDVYQKLSDALASGRQILTYEGFEDVNAALRRAKECNGTSRASGSYQVRKLPAGSFFYDVAGEPCKVGTTDRRDDESNSDFEARRERAEAEAGRWFDDLTKPQAAIYRQTIQDLAPYKGSPRWLRDRETAQRVFADTTKEAAAISEMVFGDMMALGEVSEATALAFEQVLAGAAVTLQAAE